MNIKDRIIKEKIQYPNCYEINYFLNISNEIKHFFGDVVKDSKIFIDSYLDWEIDHETEELINDEANDILFVINENINKNKRIKLENSLYVTFINNRTVKFTILDWGEIERI